MKIYCAILPRLAVVLLSGICAAPAATFTVTLNNFAFSPSSLSIGVGDSIVWTNTTTTSHTTTSGSGCSGNGLWNSGLVGAFGSVTINYASFAPGTYPFFCSPHCLTFGMVGSLVITSAPVLPPVVNLTAPAAGAKFIAPAAINLAADATQSGGSITNVQFISASGLIGNDTAAPFEFTLNNAAAGNYSFRAIAANSLGITATSSPVNVFVLTNALLSNPRSTNGGFLITLHGIAGQTYITESSSNLNAWSVVGSNVAPTDVFDVLDASGTNGVRAYRARQDL